MNAVRNAGAQGVATRTPRVRNRYLNRELSSVDFNARVLAVAEDQSTPLLERAKFLAIFASNMDEFFQVRVAGLKQQAEAGIRMRSSDGMAPRETLSAIAAKVVPLAEKHARIFADDIRPMLDAAGVKVVRWSELEDVQRNELNAMFREKIFPVLTPLAVDAGRPFPYISNLSLNLAVLIRDPVASRMHFARIKVPPLLPRFVAFSEERYFVPLEEVIAANLDQLFPGMDIVEHHTFRVTRNADLEIDDRADDLLEALEEQLTKRRARPAVRLEVEQTIPPHVLELLMSELDVGTEDIYALPAPLDLSGLWSLYAIDRPDLKDEPYQPVTHPDLSLADEEVPIFDVIGDRDVLVQHPYESFATSVQRFIEEAAADPDVLAIKQTLYRTAGSPIVNALIEAAERGKQVVVLIEIKARFDESANIAWARTLEKAGCHVVYGLSGLKTHCKLCLIVRDEGGHLRQYVHVGTGNYNPITARIYEDIGLFTSDPELAAEVAHLFNYITGFSRDKEYRCMIVAPHGMRDRMMELIEREAALSTPERPGRIIMKMNNLSDDGIVEALYDASERGVKVDLIVRSICTLRPGVKNLSKNVTVRSIVGRFLEHSRLYYFENAGEPQVYIGSPDMMPRNLDTRVEALAVVKAPELRDHLKLVLDLALSDNSSAWTLDRHGRWNEVAPREDEMRLNFQEQLMRHPTLDA
jgi:polyphosphate kinase